MKTLLERAKGSALDIVSCLPTPVRVITLLPPHTKQIRSLDFDCTLGDIRRFSGLDSGPLPLLRILRINLIDLDSPDTATSSSPLLFDNAVNLQEFSLHSFGWPPLNHFAFPNLTFLELSTLVGRSRASQLLDFLEASPKLQAVRMKISEEIFFDNVPQERVAVLPNVKSLCLAVNNGELGYRLAAHISCPSAKHTSLTHEHEEVTDGMIPWEIFPTSVSRNAIVRQYTRSPVEEITLEIKTSLRNFVITCSLTFRSPDASVIRLRFEAAAGGEDRFKNSAELYCEVFSQASRTIRDLTPLANIKRFHLCHDVPRTPYHTRDIRIANEVGGLFKSVGPLEELIFHRCDTHPYFNSFEHPGFHFTNELVLFPPIKRLTISHPLHVLGKDFVVAIVGLAKSQHALGVPFERVTVRMSDLPVDLAERLRPWVGTVRCHSELYGGD